MSHQLPNRKNIVKCPYCSIFMENGSPYQIHLMKCQRRHPEMKLEICKNNTTHRYRKADAKAHENTCPDRCYDEDDVDQVWPSPPEPSTSKNKEKANTDDWNDVDCGTYDAKSNAEKKNIIRNPPPFLTKSQRRKFDDSERKRQSAMDREKM